VLEAATPNHKGSRGVAKGEEGTPMSSQGFAEDTALMDLACRSVKACQQNESSAFLTKAVRQRQEWHKGGGSGSCIRLKVEAVPEWLMSDKGWQEGAETRRQHDREEGEESRGVPREDIPCQGAAIDMHQWEEPRLSRRWRPA
jgi:hypothetical protein